MRAASAGSWQMNVNKRNRSWRCSILEWMDNLEEDDGISYGGVVVYDQNQKFLGKNQEPSRKNLSGSVYWLEISPHPGTWILVDRLLL